MIEPEISIERGVTLLPQPPRDAVERLPFDTLRLGESLFIDCPDARERSRWRKIADDLAEAHRLATGRSYLVRSQKTGRQGVRIWCLAIPARFVPVPPADGPERLLGDEPCRAPPN